MLANTLRLLIISVAVSFTSLLYATPQIETWQTDNGAKVLYVYAPEIPMVDVRVVFDAGSARDGEKAGIASFTNSLLTEGAGNWNAYQIAERIEGVGSQLESGALRDMAWVAVRSLTEPEVLKTSLDTLSAILVSPGSAMKTSSESVNRYLQACCRMSNLPAVLEKNSFISWSTAVIPMHRIHQEIVRRLNRSVAKILSTLINAFMWLRMRWLPLLARWTRIRPRILPKR
ncbi:MAG: insulinase family protein [Candidatus Thiodiazotropha sp.]